MPSDSTAPAPVARCLVFFYYDDLPAAVRWYERVLGFERLLDLDWLVLLRCGDGLQLGLVDGAHGALRPTLEKGAIFAIETPQLEPWLARIQERDAAAIVSGIEPGGRGLIQRFVARDPGGYLVEFFCWCSAPPPATGEPAA